MLTFTPGMLLDCFNIAIIDDDLYENPEEFFANVTTTDTQVTISPMTSVITIIDNDGTKDESLYYNIFISILLHLHFVDSITASLQFSPREHVIVVFYRLTSTVVKTWYSKLLEQEVRINMLIKSTN